jgi:hypothetical protein
MFMILSESRALSKMLSSSTFAAFMRFTTFWCLSELLEYQNYMYLHHNMMLCALLIWFVKGKNLLKTCTCCLQMYAQELSMNEKILCSFASHSEAWSLLFINSVRAHSSYNYLILAGNKDVNHKMLHLQASTKQSKLWNCSFWRLEQWLSHKDIYCVLNCSWTSEKFDSSYKYFHK